MKIMAASDIHGSAYWCKELMNAYRREKPERLLLLGDILYHGPRNPLPEGYAPKEVAEMLNSIKERILCVRGNCEAEVDSLVLDFPINAGYCMLFMGGRTVHAAHGHHMPENVPVGDIVLSGHTHVLTCEEKDGILYLNPGSAALPKDGFRGYILLEDRKITFRYLDGSTEREMDL